MPTILPQEVLAPWAYFGDSWASNASKQAANQASTQAGTLFGEGQGIQAELLPFLRGEMETSHAFTPTQLNEMLTAAGAGAGGAGGAAGSDANLAAARTGNSASTGALLDKISRAKSQGLAKANEGIAGEDVAQTLGLHQAGAAGMENLYGADTGGAAKLMGIQSEDIADQIKASDTGGWMRNLLGGAMDLSKMGLNAAQAANA